MSQHNTFKLELVGGFDQEELLDEIPISNFLFANTGEGSNGDNNVNFGDITIEVEGQEECVDPLMIESSIMPLNQQDPLTVEEEVRNTTRLKRGKNVVLSSSPNISLPSASIPVVKSVTGTIQPPPSKSQLQYMTFTDFTLEMEQNIHDIVKESIGLFGRDPREYHPVYLRIYKYVTIGQRLGYIATDEAYVSSVWTGFFKFADAEYIASQEQPVVFSGERSAYATYLLTGKLLINGKVVVEKRNAGEIQKMFKELEVKAKRIRNEWDVSASPSDKIRDDLTTRLKLFKECMFVTHPSDCLKMNNLWTKFLSEEGFSRHKSGGRKRNASSSKITSSEEAPVIVTLSNNVGTDVNNEEKSRKSLRKIIKVVLAPSVSSLTPGSRSPSPPCSPGVESPPSSPVTVSSSPKPPSSTPTNPALSTAKNNCKNLRKQACKNVNSGVVQKKIGKYKSIKKQCPTAAVKKVCGSVSTNKSKTPISSMLKKKRKLLTGMATCKPSANTVSRQIQLEKILSQRNRKLLSGVVRKNQVGKANNKTEKQTKQVVQQLASSRKTHSPSKRLASKVNTVVKKGKKSIQIKNATNAITLKKQISSKASSLLLERQRKKKALFGLKKRKNFDILQKRLETVICGKKPDKNKKKILTGGEIQLRKKRVTFSFDSKYAQIKTVCPVTTCKREVSLVLLSTHLKNKHNINEDGKVWMCPFCGRDGIVKRDSWLGHIEMQHGEQVDVDMNELIEKAKQLHPDVKMPQEIEATVERNEQVERISSPNKSPSSQQTNNEKKEKQSHNIESSTDIGVEDKKVSKKTRFRAEGDSSGKSSNGSPLVICDECGVSYQQFYLPIHKELKHNPNRRKVKCPVCQKELSDPRQIWAHYCEFHMTGSPLRILDPYSKLRMPLEALTAPAPIPAPVPAPAPKKPKRDPETISTLCRLCGKNFITPSSLARHLLQVHGEGEQKEESRQCEYCSKMFKAKETLVAHVKRIHQGIVKSKCEHCSKELQTPGKLWRHLIDEHEVSTFEAAAYCEVTFVCCMYCGTPLLVGKQLNSHVRTQHPESLEEFMYAQVSERETSRKEQQAQGLPRPTYCYSEMRREARKLKKREERRRWREEGVGPAWIQRECPRRRLEDKSGKCPECGKTFSKVQKHLKLVHGIEGVDCSVEGCTAKLKCSRSYKLHMRTRHSSDVESKIVESKTVKVMEKTSYYTVYLCTLCGDYLHHFEEVKVHMVASHPHIFADLIGKDNVPAPIVPPRPPPELQCPHCPSTFSKDEAVRCHVEQDHVELCWRCPECSKVMLSPDDFEKHFAEEHCGEKKNDNDEPKDLEEMDTFVKLTIRSSGNGAGSKQERQKEREKLLGKIGQLSVICEICGYELTLRTFVRHLKVVHQLEEDNEPLVCKLCPGKVKFNIFKEGGRSLYLYHVEKYHSEKVDMEEMIKMMSKVHTKVDWRMLNVKNPKGGRLGRKLKRTKAAADEQDTSEQESDNDDQLKSKKKRSVSRSLLHRAIRRGRKGVPDTAQLKESNRDGRAGERRAKIDAIRVTCEICQKNVSMVSLTTHIKSIHGLNEDPMCCKLCPASFNIQKFGGRSGFLCHMEKCHVAEVDMQEMIQLMSKIHTKEDWRTLKIKNPEGGKRRNDRRGKGKRTSTKPFDKSEDEEVVSEAESATDKSDWEEAKQKNKSSVKRVGKTRKGRGEVQPVVLPVRLSGRNRVKPVKYAAYFNEDDEDHSDMEGEIDVKQSKSSKKCVSSRSTKSVESARGRQKVKKRKPSVSREENIERHKRLTIKLTRLTEEELRRHLKGRVQNASPSPEIKLELEDVNVNGEDEWLVEPPDPFVADFVNQVDPLC